MRRIIIDLISVWEILVSKPTNLGVIPMIGVISKDPVDGECVQGYELTKDAKKCMRAQEVDRNNEPNSPLCTGEKGRGGSIFCDEYAQVTGSRIAIGGCYDRNDNTEEYCVNYQDGKWNFCENTDICDDEGNIKSKDPECKAMNKLKNKS